MRSPSAWWDGLSGPEKFRVYTRVTLQFTTLLVVASLAAGSPTPWAVPGLVLGGLAAAVLLQVQPGLAAPDARTRRLVVWAGTATLAAAWLGYALATHLAGAAEVQRGARFTGLFVTITLTLAVLPFVRQPWWWLLALALASGLAYGAGWTGRLTATAVALGFGAFSLGSMLLTVWALRIVDDLDRARALEGRLQVADERLRFSRDLHDVVGRGFSAIAVKSELAATLSRAGEAERAAAEMDEVKVLAVESMAQMRGLVRGYRDIDLAGEVAGARSLLSAAGCRLDVEGDPARVPSRFHELAAWVTREGTTNIVKHSSATVATLAFGPAGMSLRNDGVPGGMNERSGLRGLAERAAAVGADLHAATTEEEFVLEIVWETP